MEVRVRLLHRYSYVDFGIFATFDNKSINTFREKIMKQSIEGYREAVVKKALIKKTTTIHNGNAQKNGRGV